MRSEKILFLGAGKMASAIALGMVKNNFVPEDLSAYDIDPGMAGLFTETTGVTASCNNLRELAAAAGIIVLAVKPQYLAEALLPIQDLTKDKLLISIAAGVTLEKLSALTGSEKIIRVMPNTPALVGKSAGVYATSDAVNQTEKAFASQLLQSIGTFEEAPESYFDAVTALSGSGPAYVFKMIQSLTDAGVYLGLPRNLAAMLARQTVSGSAELLQASGKHPAELCDMVTSPGGTTARALQVLEKAGFSGIVTEAVIAAAERSAQLGKKA